MGDVPCQLLHRLATSEAGVVRLADVDLDLQLEVSVEVGAAAEQTKDAPPPRQPSLARQYPRRRRLQTAGYSRPSRDGPSTPTPRRCDLAARSTRTPRRGASQAGHPCGALPSPAHSRASRLRSWTSVKGRTAGGEGARRSRGTKRTSAWPFWRSTVVVRLLCEASDKALDVAGLALEAVRWRFENQAAVPKDGAHGCRRKSQRVLCESSRGPCPSPSEDGPRTSLISLTPSPLPSHPKRDFAKERPRTCVERTNALTSSGCWSRRRSSAVVAVRK